jgi:hypothetical protein
MNTDFELAAEEFLQQIVREYYENGAGIKETMDIVAIYERYGWLFERATVEKMLDWHSTEERYFADFVAEGYLDASVKELSEKITNEITQATIEWQGERVPYRRASLLIANEPDSAKRHDLESLVQAETEKHNPDQLIRWQTLHGEARGLGYDNYLDMAEQLKCLKLEWLLGRMKDLVQQTDEIYKAEHTHYLDAIGVEPEQATPADMSFLFRAPQFDSLFPQEKLLGALKTTLSGFGIDLNNQPNIILDTDSRPLKSPRAFCAPVKIPGEVFLVISPRGGQDDYAALLHESGHAEHFAWTDNDLPFTDKRLGDVSISESYAFLMDNLLKNCRWMSEIMDVHDHQEYCRMARFGKLYMLRRYAAKLEYEMKLHTMDDLESARQLYTDTLSRSLGIKISPVNFLSDVDDGLYAAGYLRAWIFEVMLRRYLEDAYGLLWFRKPDAGAFVIGLWQQGRRYPVDELAEQIRYEGLDAEPLIRELAR